MPQIAGCDPAQAARSLEQAEGEIKTAVLLALGFDKAEAETILEPYDGNLRRVFAELATEGDRAPTRRRPHEGKVERLSHDDFGDGE